MCVSQCLFSTCTTTSVRSLRIGFPSIGCPIMIRSWPSVQERVTNRIRLGKSDCFMTAFATF